MDANAELRQGLEQMQISLPLGAEQQLLDYLYLLAKWNKAYNLTNVNEISTMIQVHILDSLTLLPFLPAVTTVLDVGTGAGLPGIPLAIARPDITFLLLDSQQKKINFVQHAVTNLHLTNVTAIQQRVEAWQVTFVADMIVSRAFASIDEFVKLIKNICSQQTQIVAMKGRKELVLQELQALPAPFMLERIEQVQVPGLDAERCLVFLRMN